MGNEKVLLVLITVTSAAISFVTCGNGGVEVILPNKDELQEIRHCLTDCQGGWKVDTSKWTLEYFLSAACQKRRMRKMEVGCKKQIKPDGEKFGSADKYMRACLYRNDKHTTFGTYRRIGEKLKRAKELIEEKEYEEIILPEPETEEEEDESEDEDDENILFEPTEAPRPYHSLKQSQPKNNAQHVALLQRKLDKSETGSEMLFSKGDVSEINDYSTFADGVCYVRYLINSMAVMPAEASCVMPCMENLFIAIGEILIEELMKIEPPEDENAKYNIHPQPDIFQMVARLIGKYTLEDLFELGKEWFIAYTKIYREINKHYVNNDALAKAVFDEKLKAVLLSYINCPKKSCDELNCPTQKALPFYEWIISPLDQDVLRYSSNDVDNTVNENNPDGPLAMNEDIAKISRNITDQKTEDKGRLSVLGKRSKRESETDSNTSTIHDEGQLSKKINK